MIHIIINRTATLLFLVAASFMLIQCDDRTDNRGSAFEEEREEMRSNLEDLRDDIDDRIGDLDSKIDDTNDIEEERNLEAQKRELRSDRSSVDRAITDLGNATEESWDRVRTDTENLYERVSAKLDDWSDRLLDRYDN